MPSSTDYAIPRVLWVAHSLQPRSVLDVGCGTGKYGVFLRFALEEDMSPEERKGLRIDGLDAYIDERTRWHDLYDNIICKSLQDALPDLPHYDLIYLGDIIEHFEKEQGLEVIRALVPKTRMGLLVTTPYHFFEQGAINGNDFERHRSLWKPGDFEAFPNSRAWVEYRRKLVALISPNSLDKIKWRDFGARSVASSTAEHLAFSTLGFERARRLKAMVTGHRPE